MSGAPRAPRRRRRAPLGFSTALLALPWLVACGDATSASSEQLPDLGPLDASDNRALSFDGVDDYASVGTARMPQIERPQTLMLWVRPDGTPPQADLQVLLTLRRSDESGIALALEHQVPLAYNVFGPRDLARASEPLAPAQWHHLAYVNDAAASTLYVDGAPAATGSTPATNRTPILAFLGSLDGYENMLHGALDELYVYDRAFSAAEVASVAAGQRLDTEPLVLYLPFDELAGPRSYDRSGLGNHAELGDGVSTLMPARVAAPLR